MLNGDFEVAYELAGAAVLYSVSAVVQGAPIFEVGLIDAIMITLLAAMRTWEVKE